MAKKNIVGWRIRQLRVEKGLTAAQLSSALPTPSYLSSEELIQVELGNRRVYDHELWAISRVLGVSVADLYRVSSGNRCTQQGPK